MIGNVKDFLDAVDKVCINCVKIDEEGACDSCPVRKTVDCLYDFASYEIWFAKEDEDCWKDYVEPTKFFKKENVSGEFRTYDEQLFLEVLYSLTEEPTASWFWVFVDGNAVSWGAMDNASYQAVAEYCGWESED